MPTDLGYNYLMRNSSNIPISSNIQGHVQKF
jgi:hypothetical protein